MQLRAAGVQGSADALPYRYDLGIIIIRSM